MALRSVGGKLLAIAGRLVRACCCAPPPPPKNYACVPAGVDSCGNSLVQCQRVESGGQYSTPNCDGQCPLPPPCECDPPCDGCSECEDGVCVPAYGQCEQCVNGTIQPLCGECELCVDGTCAPCPEGYTCVNGVCCNPTDCPPPGTYYCCYDYDDTVSPGSPDEPRTGVTSTYCFNGPCGKMIDNVFVPQAWRTVGGPYGSSSECEDNCRKHNCTPDACGNYSCTPDEAGAYLTKEDCNDNCDDPNSGQCGMSPDPFTANGVGGGSRSYQFTVGRSEFTNNREICVSYASTSGHPIRVQIWSPDISSDGCTQIASRTIKGDSQWRCQEECSCGFSAPGGCKGAPRGFVKWRTKQKGVTTFEVTVLTECDANTWQIGVTCGACIEMPNIACCCGACAIEGTYNEHTILGASVCPNDPLLDSDGFPSQNLTGGTVGLNFPFTIGNQAAGEDEIVHVSDFVNQAALDQYKNDCYQVYLWMDTASRHFAEPEQAGNVCFIVHGDSLKYKLRAFVGKDCETSLVDKSSDILTQTSFETFDINEVINGHVPEVKWATIKDMTPTCPNPLS